MSNEMFTSPEVILGFNSVGTPSDMTGKYEVNMFTTDSEFVNKLKNMDKEFYNKDGNSLNHRELNIIPAREKDVELIPGVTAEHFRIVARSKFAPTVVNTEGREITLSKNLPWGTKGTVSMTARSYAMKSTKTAGTALYFNGLTMTSVPESNTETTNFQPAKKLDLSLDLN